MQEPQDQDGHRLIMLSGVLCAGRLLACAEGLGDRSRISMPMFKGHQLTNRVHATIRCPLKLSTIVWSRCGNFRDEHGCLCKEARDRLKLAGKGAKALEECLERIKINTPETPEGWIVIKKTRFHLVIDEQGDIVHRGTNLREAEDYMRHVARVAALEEENRKLWAILREELLGEDGELPTSILSQYAQLMQ